MKHPASRDTILSVAAKVLEVEAHAEHQYLMKFHAPDIAAHAHPGSFIHLQCDPGLPMRRPMSIMRTDPRAGTMEILYKVHGAGTRLLSQLRAGDMVPILGPIGVPFKLTAYKKFPLLLGGGVGVPPMVFLAEHIKRSSPDSKQLVLMGSEIPFPFPMRPSRRLLADLPAAVIATMPLLDDLGINCRLTSQRGYPGCHAGYVTDLARIWLNNLGADQRAEVEIFACGPMPMLEAVSRLAHEYHLPCQISVEEYMACAVGGCAGCTIRVQTPAGPAMKRVCVDGPVFDAAAVFPAV